MLKIISFVASNVTLNMTVTDTVITALRNYCLHGMFVFCLNDNAFFSALEVMGNYSSNSKPTKNNRPSSLHLMGVAAKHRVIQMSESTERGEIFAEENLFLFIVRCL